MKSLVAVVSLLALSVPAAAQYRESPRHFHTRHSHAHAAYHADPAARYGASDVYVREGRAAAPDVEAPDFAWRPRSQEEGVGANLVGPGSVGNSPTGEHDVSR